MPGVIKIIFPTHTQVVTTLIDRSLLFGIPGPAGVGVPTGGTTGQVLKKVSGTNFDTYWADDSAGGITPTDINNWNTAYSWGNHAAAGYANSSAVAAALTALDNAKQPIDGDLSAIAGLAGNSGFLKKTAANTWQLDTNNYLTSETDPVFGASAAFGISGGMINNWNSAYGWGDHSAAGYANAFAVNTALAQKQPGDGDLTAIANLSTTGLARRTGTDTWVLDNTAYITLANSRAGINFTTAGTSGVATYNPVTGDMNIPNYATAATIINGTTPITSGTVGRVIYHGAGNVMQEDGNFSWDDSAGRLAINGAAHASTSLTVWNRNISSNILMTKSAGGVNRMSMNDDGHITFNTLSGTQYLTSAGIYVYDIYSIGGFGASRVSVSGLMDLHDNNGVLATRINPAFIGNLHPTSIGQVSAPNAAAMLEVVSTSRGFLPPRLTTTQRNAISSPPDGLILYNSTTGALTVRAGGVWVELGAGGGGGGGTWGSITGTLSSQTDLQNALNLKADLASPTFTGTVSGITKSMVGLGNVDNTSDANKPVSTLQAAADAAVLSSAQSYADGLVVGLWDDRGSFSAVAGTYPSTGGSGSAGAIKKGDVWTISAAGTIGPFVLEVGDIFRALVDTPGTTSSNWTAQQNNIGYTAENSANKDATGGYVGLTAYKINFKNAANTFTSFQQNSNTAARTYTFQDRNGTIADDTDIAGRQPLDSDLTAIAGLSPSNNDVLQLKSGNWTNRTLTQYLTDLIPGYTFTSNADGGTMTAGTAARSITWTGGNISFTAGGSATLSRAGTANGLLEQGFRAVVQTAYGVTASGTAQNVFPSNMDTYTFESDTTYWIDFSYHILCGTTNHSLGISFVAGGGFALHTGTGLVPLSLDCYGYNGIANGTVTPQNFTWVTQLANTTVTIAATIAGNHVKGSGYMRVDTGGTLVPQFTFSTNPGGTNAVQPGSYFKAVPIGSKTVEIPASGSIA